MATEPSTKAKAWAIFDRIVADAAPGGEHSNPWVRDESGALSYEPDYETLIKLLGVPLYLKAPTTTGVPALALDVWLSYELRRSGFDADAAWPRPSAPRILPGPVVSLLNKVTAKERDALWKRLRAKTPPTGAAASSANILGKNYLKQVDVVMSNWAAGPELLISTKRMDSSFGKNAANRVEESYGDAKNLRLRHPLAALGFVYGLRSTIFDESPDKAEWLIDLLQKLGREDDAYHAVSLIVIEYGDHLSVEESDDDQGDGEDPLVEAGVHGSHDIYDDTEELVEQSDVEVALAIAGLPPVKLPWERVPADLRPDRFIAEMVRRVIDATPVNMHAEARLRRKRALSKTNLNEATE
ncbi:hypothetical protein [Corynebacterium flavescens]|uniref:Uncharacterized protein n=1 Tax=Corynebacterium flavescens TaxID=28028 RepID=A0A1L7CNU0_CORFL|nr:hypothetical protein [Corynebacterium flavescens]APT87488.1 hypothetical protein CFLV_10160 [Corynebacterium flavescens]KAA8720302.1 hypothetical protein F4V60_09845 [Corynebacterium flavescens]GEB97030.1 hypothetical protein CFL01nite_05250 [Corynebacterium flavescens]